MLPRPPSRALVPLWLLSAALCAPLTGPGGAAAAPHQPAPGAPSPHADQPPHVLRPAPLRYPGGSDGPTVTIRMLLQLDEEGRLVQDQIAGVEPQGAPAAFVEAAREHVRALRFSPALRDGRPIAAGVTLSLRFTPPPASPAPSGASTPDAPPAAPPAPRAPPAASAPPPAAPRPPAPDPAALPPPASDGRFAARVRAARPVGERAVSDQHITVGKLAAVPRRSAAELLTLAPGILLVNLGGAGHAQQVFLRGFDAREGQDLEFSVNGVPINEVANAHGQGYADSHFLIPELIESLRVVEGPFDPRQGDFAVAGSAEYHLAAPERGLRVSYQGGSFNTHRLLALWAPTAPADSRLGLGRDGTFAAVELQQSSGYGQNRFSQRAAAHAGWELPFGETGVLRLLALSYATRFKSPGVVRQDDYQSGRVDFFGTYDDRQGGDAQRHGLSAELRGRAGLFELRQLAFLTFRELRLRENFTGYHEDPQRVYQASRGADPQRGDLIDQFTSELTVGARGSAQLRAVLLGQPQRFEVGYYARYDRTDASQQRLRSKEQSSVPYRTDFSFQGGVTDLAAYADLELSPWRPVSLRGGVRGDLFVYDVLSRCDSIGAVFAGAPKDVSCYSGDRYGYREPTARRSATGLALQPRVTLSVQPLRDLHLSASYGHGARSADAAYLADGEDAPFASIRAAEGGAVYHRAFLSRVGPFDLTARGAFFYTHVDRDLIFNQTVGRPTLANGTTRIGVIAAARLLAPFLDAAMTLTWARATFDDSGLLVPYVPKWVYRADIAGFGPLPKVALRGERVVLTGGLGFTYVAPRPLPFSEYGDAYVLLDLSLRARWSFIEVGVAIENALDRRYRLAEFNYVSDFRSRPYPTEVAARHFIAGPPLSALATLTIDLERLLTLRREPAPRRRDEETR